MSTFLFDEIIFGPVFSRRLGISLGINLLPSNLKFCNFDCIYCECGLSDLKNKSQKPVLPNCDDFILALENKLKELVLKNKPLNAITFAGNGEPTLHPDFEKIIDQTILLRNKYFPEVKIAVLSNSTFLGKEHIFKALSKIEMPILKLDSAIENTVKIINSPPLNFSIPNLIDNLLKFEGKFILQTMFLKGSYKNEVIDNTTEVELNEWLKIIEKVKPQQVMIYTIARETPVSTLEKISLEKLEQIAEKVKKLGIETQISA